MSYRMMHGIGGEILAVHARAMRTEKEITKNAETMRVFMNEEGAEAEIRDLKTIKDHYGRKSMYDILVRKELFVRSAKARLIRGYGGFQRYLIMYKKVNKTYFRIGQTTVQGGSSVWDERVCLPCRSFLSLFFP